MVSVWPHTFKHLFFIIKKAKKFFNNNNKAVIFLSESWAGTKLYPSLCALNLQHTAALNM